MNQVFVNKVMAISTGLGLLAAPQLPAGQASTVDRLLDLGAKAEPVQPQPLPSVVLSGAHSISNSALSTVRVTSLVQDNGGRFKIQTTRGHQCTLTILPLQGSFTSISLFQGESSQALYSQKLTKPTALRLPVARSEYDFLVVKVQTEAGTVPATIVATSKPATVLVNSKQEGVHVEGPVVNTDGTQIGTINIK